MPGKNGKAMSSVCDDPAKTRVQFRFWHVLTAFVVVLVAVVLALRWHWLREYDQRVKTIAAAGYPVTPEELDAWYAWPDSGENAASWVIAAGDRLSRPPKGDYSRLRELARNPDAYSNRQPLPEDLRDLLIQHVEANSEALTLLHAAARIEESRYPIDLSDGCWTLMPYVSVYGELHSLLCLEALLCIERADGGGAVRAIEDALGIAHSLDAEPVILSQGVRLRAQFTALSALERLLSRQALTEANLKRLDAAVRGAHDPHAMERALVGERCMLIDLCEAPELIYQDALRPSPSPPILEAYEGLGLAAREGMGFLDMIAELQKVIQLPMHRRVEAVAAAEARFRGRLERSILLPADLWAGHFIVREIECMARLRAASAALAAERFRLETGHWPGTLTELVPEYRPDLTEDPFDGKPLRYRRVKGGFVVYSVGGDRLDDDGRPLPPPDERQVGETYDVTFDVRR